MKWVALILGLSLLTPYGVFFCEDKRCAFGRYELEAVMLTEQVNDMAIPRLLLTYRGRPWASLDCVRYRRDDPDVWTCDFYLEVRR